MLTTKQSLFWLGIVAAVSSLRLLSTLKPQPLAMTAAPISESAVSAHPAGNEPVTPTSVEATVPEHAVAKPKPAMTLSELLEDNHTLLEVIGVFTAVSVFIGQLQIRWFAHVLSFLFMVLVVVVCVELWTKFPRGTGSMKVLLFEYALTAVVFFLFLDLFVDYRDIWTHFLYVPIFLVLSCPVLLGFVVPALRAVIPKNRVLRKAVGLVISAVVIYLSMRAAVHIEPGANRFFDAVNRLVSGWTK